MSKRIVTYYTVYYEKPHKKTGKMQRHVTDYCENPQKTKQFVEKHGGKIISVGPPRKVEVEFLDEFSI